MLFLRFCYLFRQTKTYLHPIWVTQIVPHLRRMVNGRRGSCNHYTDEFKVQRILEYENGKSISAISKEQWLPRANVWNGCLQSKDNWFEAFDIHVQWRSYQQVWNCHKIDYESVLFKSLPDSRFDCYQIEKYFQSFYLESVILILLKSRH